jgi:hypothetical protein
VSAGPLWEVRDHVCRVCFGRIVSRDATNGRRVFRCVGCGAEKQGQAEAVICACGIKLKTGGDAGIRCLPNPAKTPEFPAEIVAAQVATSGKF